MYPNINYVNSDLVYPFFKRLAQGTAFCNDSVPSSTKREQRDEPFKKAVLYL